MTIYNILFPFLILVALGIALYILTKHLPEAVEHHEISEKEEKKRRWQILLGKGENLLRSMRVLLLKLDNKLNNSIKQVREKKEKMGEGLREYRSRSKQKSDLAPVDHKGQNHGRQEETQDSQEIISSEESVEDQNSIIGDLQSDEEESLATETKSTPKQVSKKGISNFAKKISSLVPRSQNKPPVQPKSRTVEEILRKTFTQTELKVEKEQYWKKKEEMLIQSIVRDHKNVGLYLQLGRLYSNQHNWKDARNAFLEVLKLDKTNVKAKEELKRIEKYIED